MREKAMLWMAPAVVLALCSCSQDRNKKGMGGDVAAPARPAAVAPTRKAGELRPGDYTGGVWLNGVHKETKDRFFLVVAKDSPIPVRVGDRLRFPNSGDALVVNVHRQEKERHRLVFVRVDRKLDPAGDGYPAAVEILGHELRASAFSDGKDWQNGILLKNRRVFVFVQGADDTVPFRVGCELRFHGSGRATVKGINQRNLSGGSRQVFVEVDHSLDPGGDGFPHPIEIVAEKS